MNATPATVCDVKFSDCEGILFHTVHSIRGQGNQTASAPLPAGLSSQRWQGRGRPSVLRARGVMRHASSQHSLIFIDFFCVRKTLH